MLGTYNFIVSFNKMDNVSSAVSSALALLILKRQYRRPALYGFRIRAGLSSSQAGSKVCPSYSPIRFSYFSQITEQRTFFPFHDTFSAEV